MTETFYYQDTNKSEFEAKILEVVKEKKSWRVVLDKTCFYPEGGANPRIKDGSMIYRFQMYKNKEMSFTTFSLETRDKGQSKEKSTLDGAKILCSSIPVRTSYPGPCGK